MWAVAATTCAVLVVGGITRLTRSGLSIVEWQPLVGAVPPLSQEAWEARFRQYQAYPEFQQLRDGMTLAEFKVIFFWEYLHRLLARAIGLVFLVPFVFFWRAGTLTAPLARRTLCLLSLGLLQGAMGWWMVRSGLVDRPSVSHYRLAAHFSLALVIFASAVWMARELGVGSRPAIADRATRALLTRGLAVVGVLLGLQVVWGALVAGLKAGLLFGTFPLMAGRWVPEQLLVLEPPLLNLVANAATVQWIHRVLGTMLVAAALVLFARARRAGLDPRSRVLNRVLALLIGAQYLLGVLTLVLGMPIAVATLHQAAALAIIGVWVVWIHHARNLETAPQA
jgi:cytochrome c oxidase assembly protein subunit 15